VLSPQVQSTIAVNTTILFAVLPIKKLAANLPVAIRDPKGLGSGSDATNLHMNMVPNC